MDDKKLRKLKNIARIEEPDMALLQVLEEIDDIKEQIEEKIPALKEIIQQVKGKDGKDGKDYVITEEDLNYIVKEVRNLIPTPKNGKDGVSPTIDYKKIIKEVLSNIPIPKDGEDGEDGKDAIIDYDKIITDASRKVLESILIPEETGETIIQKINEDNTSIIKKEKVEGLSEIEKMARLGSINAQNSHIWQGVSEVRVKELISNDKILHPSTDTDEKVAYKSGSTPGYLKDVTVAGTGITLEEGTGGDAGKLKITNSLDLSGYVPYTGATADLNLGTHSITASNFTGSSSGSNTGDQDLSNLVEEAPSDDKQYARKNAGWVEVEVGSTGDGIGFDIDGFGIVPSTTVIGSYVAKKSGTITGWKIIESNGVSSSIVLTVKKNGTEISGTEKPTLSNASSAEDIELTTWTTSIAKGDIISISIDSVSVGTKFFLQIYYS